jgi:hypothetical protein
VGNLIGAIVSRKSLVLQWKEETKAAIGGFVLVIQVLAQECPMLKKA